MRRVSFIPGDGIGPEIMDAARRVVDASGVAIEWEVVDAGEATLAHLGTPLPEETLASVRRNKVALKGPTTAPAASTGFKSASLLIRHKLGLYANVRPAKTFPGAESHYPGLDLVVIRECTQDVYSGVEQMVGEEAAIAIKFFTRTGCMRIAEFAFDYAMREGRRKISVAHKTSAQPLTDGLFLGCAAEVAQRYPQIEFEGIAIDHLCMQLVRHPYESDILLLPLTYGDLVSDLCAGLIGGLGLAPGALYGDGMAVFEAAHGSAPKYTGQNKANPTAMILSAAMMLRYIGAAEAARRVEEATQEVIREGRQVTYDLGGRAGTREMAGAIVAKLKA